MPRRLLALLLLTATGQLASPAQNCVAQEQTPPALQSSDKKAEGSDGPPLAPPISESVRTATPGSLLKPLTAGVRTSIFNGSGTQSMRIARPPNPELSAGASRSAFTGNAGQALIDPSNFKAGVSQESAKFRLNANRSILNGRTSAEVLSSYQLELLVDRSMSMSGRDCPGGLSRWNWCGQQSAELAQALAPFTKNGLTIATFASKYDVFEHSTSQHIYNLFNEVGLQGGTRLFEPLAERLDNYFAHYRPGDRPLLIVVVTDGVPVPRFEPTLVRDELVKASERMSYPNQVTVLFCQIGGGDMQGRQYLSDLAQNLVGYGAKYQYVHTIFFDTLQNEGLGQSLARTIVAHAPVTHTGRAPFSPGVNNSDFRLPSPNSLLNQHAINPWNPWPSFQPGMSHMDEITQNPTVDNDGVRHFSNGQHFDLNTMPLEQVLSEVNAPTLTDYRRAQRQQERYLRHGMMNRFGF